MYRTVVNGEIAFIQSQDVVRRGQGALYVAEGGLESSNVALWSLSGYNEPIDRSIEIFGYAH